MKKAIAVLLALGIIIAGIGMVNANTLNITANVMSSLTLQLDPISLTFDNVQQGVPSASNNLKATTKGAGSYQLQLSSSTFTTAGGTQPASVLQFKETSAGTYSTASGAPQNMLIAPGTATVDGEVKNFDIRVNFPAGATNGAYAATVTIAAAPL